MQLLPKDIAIGPHQVSMDITHRCNFRCLHCYNSSGEDYDYRKELSDEEVLDFIDDLKDIKLLNYCFCGGETLLRKELIYKAAKKLKKYGCQNIAMVSNGWLLSEDVAKKLKESGVTKVQISLDGATPESHEKLRNKKDAFKKATEAIKILVRNGFQVGVSFVPTNFNIEEVEELHEYLKNVGISETLRIQPIMIMGRASENQETIEPTSTQYRGLVKNIREINQRMEAPLIEWGDPIDHLIRFRKQRMLVSMVQIRSNGDIMADQYLPIVVGNLRKHSILDYWNNGLNKIWETKVVQEIASSMMCVKEMDIENNKYLADSFKCNQIYYDLIDDASFYNNYGKEGDYAC